MLGETRSGVVHYLDDPFVKISYYLMAVPVTCAIHSLRILLTSGYIEYETGTFLFRNLNIILFAYPSRKRKGGIERR